MTGAEIQERILSRVDENAEAPVSCTPEEALTAANEGQELFAFATLCIERTATITLPANRPYALVRGAVPDYLVPLRVECGGVWVRPGRLVDLDARNPEWQITPGVPARYCSLGFNVILFDRAPVDDLSVKLVYAAAPALMVGDAWPEVPEAYHQTLVDYGVYRARGPKNGGAMLASAIPYLRRFLDDTTRYADFVRARSRAQAYDVLPFEMQLFDRSRLLGQAKKPTQ